MAKKIFFILIQFTFICACSNPKFDRQMVDNAECIVNQYPDGAIQILERIEYPEKLDDSTKANYWLVMAMAHHKKKMSIVDDSLVINSMRYYKNTNDTERLLQAYRLSAICYWWNGDKDNAYKLIDEGINLKRTKKSTLGEIKLYLAMSYLADKDDDLDKGLVALKKLIEIDKNSPTYYRYYNDLGIIYYYKDDKDSSTIAFKRALEISSEDMSSKEDYFYVLQNYADILNEFGEHKEAIALSNEALDYYIKTNSANVFLSYFSLSRCYLNIGESKLAQYYMTLTEKHRPTFSIDDLAISNLLLIHQTILDYVEKGKYDLKDIALFSNSMSAQYSDKERIIIEKTKTKQNLERQNLKLTISKQHNQIVLLAILVLIIILVIFVYFLNLKREKRYLEREEELDTLKNLLDNSQKTNAASESFFKQILLQQLGIIRLAAASPTAQNQEFLKQMTRITNKDVPIETLLVWSDLFRLIDSLYDNFYTNLMTKYGDILIDKEIQLCCLLLAGFSTKEISVVTQQSVRTIYQRKTIIRQKLKMDEKEDIIEFIRQNL